MPEFREARDFLLANRTDYQRARAGFQWPEPKPFNWAIEWFDGELATSTESRDRTALWILDVTDGSETKLTFQDLSRRSNQVANEFRRLGLRRGDHLLVLLGNVPALWEATLAAMKLGLVVIPATVLLTAAEISDRIKRGHVRALLSESDQLVKCEPLVGAEVVRIAVGQDGEAGWHRYEHAFAQPTSFEPDGPTAADDLLFQYFTSGTTAQPKLVCHSQRSYAVGSLSTMYWLGLQPGDIHLNVSSPGWAKHAWSSLFAPWNAGATVLVVNQAPFNAKILLQALERCAATTFCAPPTVWRLLIQHDLSSYKVSLREVCGAGEPLNPEVIEQVRRAWGLMIRDGYGQSESTAQIANSPGQQVNLGAMGRPLPGYTVRLVDVDGNAAAEGEVCLVLGPSRPAGLMLGYQDDDGQLVGVDGDLYRTGDIASLDGEGYLTFVGRSDDIFKSSDYRISPFELESVLIEHEAVGEAAVVPSPDAIRLSVPKAFVTLRASAKPTRETAVSIFRHTNARLPPFKRIRIVEFVTELPKTISGKIRRVHLRRVEQDGIRADAFRGSEFREVDLPEIIIQRTSA